MLRRDFLLALSGMALAYTARSIAGPAPAGDQVTIMKFSDDGKPLGLVTLPKVNKDAEWKKRLSPLAYEVTRQQGTERAFSQPGYDRHEPGLYRCVCCDNALFDSSTKYDSGTGWPSFWQPIAAGERAQHHRPHVRHDPHRSALRPVRCAPRPCVRRRAEADRVALLHEHGGAALRAAAEITSNPCARRLRRLTQIKNRNSGLGEVAYIPPLIQSASICVICGQTGF